MTAMESLRAAHAQAKGGEWVLHLYVAGLSQRSIRAVDTVRRVCERHLSGKYRLTVTDIYQDPARAEEGQVVAAPTLVREMPRPLRRVIGNIGDEARLLTALGMAG